MKSMKAGISEVLAQARRGKVKGETASFSPPCEFCVSCSKTILTSDQNLVGGTVGLMTKL